MSNKVNRQAVVRLRGMYDVLPKDVWIWQGIEAKIRQLFQSYQFHEIRFPLLEETRLFHTAIGEATDVVEKEMFSFEDRSGNKISLRPEGTAGCVRSVIQNNLCNRGLTQKLWYQGPMFRYERPQKGRNRQFTQIGAEIFNLASPQADAELILLTARLWKELKLPNIRLEINSLGETSARRKYREVLIQYFESHKDILDEDAINRLHKNPLRILDSKNPNMQEIINKAPILSDYLDDESKQHFEQLKVILDACQIEYEINPKLVRGLDYYSKTVFEWITTDLGSQGTICGGGRYDSLVELQGGKPTPAVGFAMGLDRIVELIVDLNLWQKPADVDAYLMTENTIDTEMVMANAEKIRNALPHITLFVNQTSSSFKAQFKKADKLSAHYAIIIGDNEIQKGTFTVKPLKDRNLDQQELDLNGLIAYFSKNSEG